MKVVYLMLIGLACTPAADEKDIARLPDGPGKELAGKICTSCHDSGNFRKARFTSEEWTDSVDDMVQRGASGTPAEIEAVVAYLTKNFGKDSGVRIEDAVASRSVAHPVEKALAVPPDADEACVVDA